MTPPIPPTPPPSGGSGAPTSADFASLTSAISTLTSTMAPGGGGGGGTGGGSILSRLTNKLDTLGNKLEKLGVKLENFTKSLNKTQKEFGISLANAATLQANLIVDTVKDTADILTNIDYGAVIDGLKVAGSGLFDTLGQLFTGGGVKGGAEAFKKTLDKLNAPIPGKAPGQLLLSQERLEGIVAVQDEFGVINKEMGVRLAQYAKDNGLNVRDLVKAQRVFSTTVRGDLSQVGKIQTRFFDEFSRKGLTPRVALDAISKYADLIARNGTRFADSFARAAADAKKIGVDLSKVDQIGDNIVDNFEGFLEGQAELGAMGFGFDTSRLAELAEMGDTGALFTELRSQLAGMGKDITKLRRSERLALESAFGINIGELQRLAGGTPQITPEDLQKESNSMLQQILTLMQVGGPLLTFLSNIAASLATPGGLAIATILGIGTWLKSHFDKKRYNAEKEATSLFGQNKAYEARDILRQAGFDKSEIEKFTQDWLTTNNNVIQQQIIEGKIKGATFSKETGKNVFTPTDIDIANRTLMTALKDAARNASPERADGGIVIRTLDDPAVKRRLENRETATVINKKAQGGIVTGPGTGTSDSIPARLSSGEYVLNAKAVSLLGTDALDKLNNIQKFATGGLVGKGMSFLSSKVPGLSSSISTFAQGGTGGLKSNLLGTTGSFLSGKVPGLSSSINAFTQGGVGGLKSNLVNTGLGFLGGKIPGLSGAMSTFSAFKEGGVKGALGSLAKGGIGKAIGGAIGTAIPIPGVGTMIGSVLGSKIGKFAGGLFGKKKGIAAPMGMEAMSSPDLATMMGSQEPAQQTSGPQQAPIVDTSGIEQKLNNFINALQNIQINMDGNQVGKVLVKTSEAAASRAVFRTQAR